MMSVGVPMMRGGLLFGVLAGLVVACGPNGGTTPPPNGPPAMGGDKTKEASHEWEKCNAQAERGDATACWKTWLDEYANSASKAELAYAQRMAHTGVDKPVNPDPPKPDDHDKHGGGPKVINIDESHPPPKAGGGGGTSDFPPQTVAYGDCWRGARLTGDFAADYNNLVNACGKPTGMLPFSKPMTGELNDDHKGDVYTVKLVGGACYRIFAVAGGTIKDIDIAIATMENKIVAADKYTQPVAVIEWQKPVCVEHDVQFKLVVARDGGGSGGYGFGIWFKPAGGAG